LRKLPAVIADRARLYADADPAARADLEAELNDLMQQVRAHAETLEAWNLDPGRGYVAAEDGTRPDPPKPPPPGHTWYQVDGTWYLRRLVGETGNVPKQRYDPKTGEIVPDDGARQDGVFDPGATREDAFDLLGGNDASSPFGRYIDALKQLGLIENSAYPSDFIGQMPDPGGRGYRGVRHKAKEYFNGKMLELITDRVRLREHPAYQEGIDNGLTPDEALVQASRAELVRISDMLHSSDRGSLGERWYLDMLASDGAQTQVRFSQQDAAEQGLTLGKDRNIDIVDGDKAVEIKNVSGGLDERAKEQLEDFARMIGKNVRVQGEKVRLKEAVVFFPDPQGVRANAKWLRGFLNDAEDPDLHIETFDANGRRVSIFSDGKELFQVPERPGGGTILDGL
ncbi:MAG: hypothetical protein HOV68_29335, partial [Streptomycetaceae bacterium]|nr:hypothetical protein [Streptomycetaceae bacterium]